MEIQYNFKCHLCFFKCVSHDELIKHYLKNHRQDPQFMIECLQRGCGSTFQKWNSFIKHMSRKHPDVDILPQEIGDEFNDQLDENLDDDQGANQIPMDLDEDEVYNQEEFHEIIEESPTERIRRNALQFIISIRENCNISQNSIGVIIDGVQNLIDVYIATIIEELNVRKDPETHMLHFDSMIDVCKNTFPPTSVFSYLKTQKVLDKILVQDFNMVTPQKIVLGTSLKWKKRKIRSQVVKRICKVTHDAYVISLLANLTNLLQNPSIRYNILNPKPHIQGVYRTVLDGRYYQEDDFFRNNKNALAIILYYDDVGVANPYGAAAKSQKLSMFYWTLANIHPEFRSSKNCVQLYAITKTENLKKEGALDKILRPFIKDVQYLKTIGIDIEVQGQMQNFKGALLFCAGDTPASALLGGFKESVSAYRPCRTCNTTIEEFKTNFCEDDFRLRNKLEHADQIAAVTDRTITKAASNYWKTFYGINSKSPLMDIIDVTACLPQDAMHILIEGPLQTMCKLILQYCIVELKLFTVTDFNLKLSRFDFAHFKCDKPAQIQQEHLSDNGILRQSAAQTFTLSHTLLFLINEWTVTCTNENLHKRIRCFILLLQITNITLAYTIREEYVDLLSRMIQIFLHEFTNLFPDVIVPKFHFLIHVVHYIREFGPSRQQWCFRFEATHAYFKRLVPVVRNFKNMALTLAYRHQARLCSQLISYPGMSSKTFLYKGDFVAPGETVLVRNLPFATIFSDFVSEEERFTCQMMRTKKIIVNGTTYQCKSIILIEIKENEWPEFGQVHEIFIYNRIKLLVYFKLETIHYESSLNSYIVSKISNRLFVKTVKSLVFPHPLSSFMVQNHEYVPLINHDHVEFY